MKTIIKSIFVLFLAISFTNCEKESEGLTRITYYAELLLEGETTITVPLGGSFTEPGYSATENGVDRTGDVVVENNVDYNTAGLYDIVYSIENSDGYLTTATRTIIVAFIDSEAPESGVWNTSIVRTEADGSNPRPRAFSIVFVNEGDDVFYVGGLLGYYYAAGYGPAYAMLGRIKLDKATNTFTLIESHVEGWGDGLEDFRNASYDPATETMYWESIYAGNDTFAVTLTK